MQQGRTYATEPASMVTISTAPGMLVAMPAHLAVSSLKGKHIVQGMQQSRNMPLNPLAWSPAVQALTVAGAMMVAALVWSSLRRPSLTNQRQNVTM